MVGQWSFWCTHASSNSFLSLSDRDCWKCKVENLMEPLNLDLGAVLICRTCTPSPVVPLTKTALTPPFAKCLRQKKDIKWPISVGLQNTRKIYEKNEKKHIFRSLWKWLGPRISFNLCGVYVPIFLNKFKHFIFSRNNNIFFENVIFIEWRVILFIFFLVERDPEFL